jgi:hypothetical protein
LRNTIGEALALLAPGSHQLVIADVLLPDGRGYAVASALGIMTILMSGHPDKNETLKMGRVEQPLWVDSCASGRSRQTTLLCAHSDAQSRVWVSQKRT